MKFPNFKMNKWFTARAFVLLAGLFLMASVGYSQSSEAGSIGVEIQQCANGPATAPIHCNTSGSNQGYGRGNLVASKSHYLEGDSVPIRIVSSGLTVGTTYTITIGYDYTKGGKYATDYLTDYDRTESVLNNPCVDVAGCSLASETNFPIPTDPEVTAGFDKTSGTSDDIVQIPGEFSCFGCTITAASAYSRTGLTTGDSSKFITLTFTADQTNAVIAYGSHISTRKDWGQNNSAINITGSPYHNFVQDFPGANSGNRDLQLSADAVVFPASVTIVKLVVNVDLSYSNNFQNFGFTSTNFGTSPFALMDTDPSQLGGGSITNANITTFGAAGTITVTEDDQTGKNYDLGNMSCNVDLGGGFNLGTATPGTLASRTVTIVPQEGNVITCTFTNNQLRTTAAPASVSGRVTTAYGSGISGARVSIVDFVTGETRSTLTNTFGYYTFSGLEVGHFYQLGVSAKKYTFQQSVKSFSLTSDLADANFVAN